MKDQEIQLLERKGYKVTEGSQGYYQIYLNDWYSRKKGKFPLIITIHNGNIHRAMDFGSLRRKLRTARHSKRIRKLLKLEDI